MKRITIGIFLFMFMLISFGVFPNESSASLGSIPDGNATGSNYSPTDVDPSIKRAWERWNANDRKMFRKGGKGVEETPSKGLHLVYDVYDKGWTIKDDTLVFEGWSANIGYYHHDRYNQATYIGAVRVDKGKATERKIFKAEMLTGRHAATK